MKKRMIAGVLTLLLAVGALSGCSSSGDNGKTIVVGAKGFSENLIVAELYALALEDLGYTVRDSTPSTPTWCMRPLLPVR